MKAAVIISVILAAATTWWTWMPSRDEISAATARTPELLTLDGKKIVPEDVTSLRVATWDTESKETKVFEVARKSNVWVIPSKFDYPADGGSRVGKTAGCVLNVPRGPLVTSDPKLHADLGVVDPMKEGSADGEGRGKRVTLKDTTGATVVDLIVGKHSDKLDVTYVREAKSDDVYTAKVDVDISTTFKDWVETDPIKLLSADLRMLGVKDYSLNVEEQKLEERASTVFTRAKDKTEWSCDKVPAEKIVNQDTLGKLLGEVGAIRLVDVLPFSSPNLLEDYGFFRTEDNRLYSKEGVLQLGTKDGLIYHLYFGNVAVTDEDKKAKDAAKDKDKAKDADKDKDAAPKQKNRYMAVFVGYEAKADESAPAKAPVGIAKPDEKAEEKKEGDGQKRAMKAQARFLKFFYVISDETFQKLRPEVATLFKSKDQKDNLPGEKIPKEINLDKAPNGLQHADMKAGEGDEAATGDDVEVQYTGWLENGTKFDSSLDHGGQPFRFTLGGGNVIKGWDEGVVGMKIGGKRKLVIPSELGYGPNGSPPKIPGGSTLVFDIELLKVTKKNAPAKPEPKAETPEKKSEEAKTEPAKKEETKTEAPKKEEAKSEPAKTEAPKAPEAKTVEPKKEAAPKTEDPAKTQPKQ